MSTKPQAQPVSSFPEDEEPLSVAQAAQLVGISEQALRKRIRKGTLPAHKLRRGNQVVTALAPSALEAAYPSIKSRPRPPLADTQPVQQPSEKDPGATVASSEQVVRLRENLATAVAAQRAAESRCEAAETRASMAEEKFERALVQRGDEVARARKEAERQSLQMAMEIARAQMQTALPAAAGGLPAAAGGSAVTERRWFGGFAVGALIVAGGAVFWGSRVWKELGSSRASEQAMAGQVIDLQGRTSQAFERAISAEEAHLKARDEVSQTKLEVADERLQWQAQETRLEQELAAQRASSETLRRELAWAHLRRRAQANVIIAADWLRNSFVR